MHQLGLTHDYSNGRLIKNTVTSTSVLFLGSRTTWSSDTQGFRNICFFSRQKSWFIPLIKAPKVLQSMPPFFWGSPGSLTSTPYTTYTHAGLWWQRVDREIQEVGHDRIIESTPDTSRKVGKTTLGRQVSSKTYHTSCTHSHVDHYHDILTILPPYPLFWRLIRFIWHWDGVSRVKETDT